MKIRQLLIFILLLTPILLFGNESEEGSKTLVDIFKEFQFSFIIVIIVIIVAAFWFLPIREWYRLAVTERLDIDLNEIMRLKGVPIEEIIYILKKSKEEGLGINSHDIEKHLLQKIDSKKLIELLRISQRESLGISIKDLKTIFLEKIDEQHIIDVLIKAKKYEISLEFKDIEDLYVHHFNINQYVDALIRNKAFNLELSKDDIKHLFYERIDIDRFFAIAVKAKNGGLVLSYQKLLTLFYGKGELEQVLEVLIDFNRNGINLSLVAIEELSFVRMKLAKLSSLLIDSNTATLKLLGKHYPTTDFKVLQNVANTFYNEGIIGLERSIAASLPVMTSVGETVEQLLDHESLAFKINLEHLKDLALIDQHFDDALESWLLLRQNNLKFEIKFLRTLLAQKINVIHYAEAKLLCHTEKLQFPLDDFTTEEIARIDIPSFIYAYTELLKNNWKFKNCELYKIAVTNIDIKTLIKLLLDFKTKNVDIPIESISNLLSDRIDIIKVVEIYGKLCINVTDTSLEELQELSMKRIDIVNLAEAIILLKDNGENITINDLKAYNLAKIDPVAIITNYLELRKLNNTLTIKQFVANKLNSKDIIEIHKAYQLVSSIIEVIGLQQLIDHKVAGGSPLTVVQAIRTAAKANVEISFALASKIDLSDNLSKVIEKATKAESFFLSPVITKTKDDIQLVLKVKVAATINLTNYLSGFGSEMLLDKVKESLQTVIGNYDNRQMVLAQLATVAKQTEKQILENEAFVNSSEYTLHLISIIDTTIGKDLSSELKVKEAEDNKRIALANKYIAPEPAKVEHIHHEITDDNKNIVETLTEERTERRTERRVEQKKDNADTH